ncbi:MAG: hypothetical protein ACXVJ0_01460 [Candidatus Angelobacter sp.]
MASLINNGDRSYPLLEIPSDDDKSYPTIQEMEFGMRLHRILV